MEFLKQAQTLLSEHMITVGIALLIAVILAGGIWFWISRGSQKNPTLLNQARVNEMNTSPEEQLPTQEQLEEMANYKPQPSSMQQVPSEEESQ